MKKKHRDIVVDGVTYGWIAINDYNKWLKIFKTKNDFVKFDIPDYLDITPKMVAELIKDPLHAMLWITAKPCPFCGKTIEPFKDTQFLLCEHEKDCWLSSVNAPTLIPKHKFELWNKRTSF